MPPKRLNNRQTSGRFDRADALPGVLSLYLDLTRAAAAFVVVLHHVWPIVAPGFPVPWPGHEAVVVFFVLSGLVIAHSVDKPGIGFADYLIQRLARVWSVAVPALAIALAIGLVFPDAHVTDVAPGAIDKTDLILGLLASLVPVANIWTLQVVTPLDAPFWSLNYEIWYYCIFGCWSFIPGRKRGIVAGGLCLIAGPKMVLLFPVWLVGVAVYRYRPVFTPCVAIIIYCATSVASFAYIQLHVSVLIRQGVADIWPDLIAHLFASNQFVGDFVLALLVALHFAAVASLSRHEWILAVGAAPIRASAKCTLSIYLYHMPCVVFFICALRVTPILGLLLATMSVVLLARVTEWKTAELRDAFRRSADAIRQRRLGRGLIGQYLARVHQS